MKWNFCSHDVKIQTDWFSPSGKSVYFISVWREILSAKITEQCFSDWQRVEQVSNKLYVQKNRDAVKNGNEQHMKCFFIKISAHLELLQVSNMFKELQRGMKMMSSPPYTWAVIPSAIINRNVWLQHKGWTKTSENVEPKIAHKSLCPGKISLRGVRLHRLSAEVLLAINNPFSGEEKLENHSRMLGRLVVNKELRGRTQAEAPVRISSHCCISTQQVVVLSLLMERSLTQEDLFFILLHIVTSSFPHSQTQLGFKPVLAALACWSSFLLPLIQSVWSRSLKVFVPLNLPPGLLSHRGAPTEVLCHLLTLLIHHQHLSFSLPSSMPQLRWDDTSEWKK